MRTEHTINTLDVLNFKLTDLALDYTKMEKYPTIS